MLDKGFEKSIVKTDDLNYFCTWQMQNSILGKDFPLMENAQRKSGEGKGFAMNMMDEDLLLKQGGYLDEFPLERNDLYFMLDYAWDIDYVSDAGKNMQYFGGLELSKEKFPSFTGTPAERLKALNDTVRSRGWRGLLLWIPTQPEGSNKKEDHPDFDEGYWRERFSWLKYAQIKVVKLDLGAFMHDVEYRRRVQDVKDQVYPELIIEQTICPSPLSGNVDADGRFIDDWRAPLYTATYSFSQFFRSGDATFELGDITTLDRIAHLLKSPNKHIGCEDSVIIAASLGFSFGIIRSSIDDTQKDKRLKEVSACVCWHKLAPPFEGGTFSASDDVLYSSYTYGETWVPRASNKTVTQGAPRIVARSTPLPHADGTRYICASANPSGAYSIASIPRPSDEEEILPEVICYPPESTRIFGIFGNYSALSFKIGRPEKVLCQSLIDGDLTDITDKVGYKDGLLTVQGSLLTSLTHFCDESENAVAMMVFYPEAS